MILQRTIRTHQRFVWIVCGLLCLMATGCAEDTNDPQPTNKEYQFETAEALTAAKVTLTQVGSPIWKPTDFKRFSASIGNEGDNFAGFFTSAQCIFNASQSGKNFVYDNGAPISQREHPNAYFEFMTESVSACQFETKTTFTADEAKNSKGVYYAFNVVPQPGLAPTGASPYKSGELIIPNSRFPITVKGSLLKDGVDIDPQFEATVPALSTQKFPGSSDAIPGDGYPHFPLVFAEAYDFIKDKVPEDQLAGSYELKLELRDAEQSGWTVSLSYTVQ